MGEMKDVFTLKKGNLTPISRDVMQGPVAISLKYMDGKVTGTMTMNGNEQPIDVTLDQGVFADGAALYETLARLPLAEGYSTVYRVFDVQTQKVRPFELTVLNKEKVNVADTEKEAYKTEVKPLDDQPGGSILWFSTSADAPGLVRSEATVPSMGGATVIMELQP